MTAAARIKTVARPSALEVFGARAEARAMLWAAGEIDLHDAVDELWAAAVRDGLVAKLGADKVQQLLADAFAPVRDDLVQNAPESGASHTTAHAPERAHDDYDPSSTFAKACREADEKPARKSTDPHIEKLRRLLDDDLSIESAWQQLGRPLGVPIAMLWAAEYLIQLGDLERWKKWFDARTAQERAAILDHL